MRSRIAPSHRRRGAVVVLVVTGLHIGLIVALHPPPQRMERRIPEPLRVAVRLLPPSIAPKVTAMPLAPAAAENRRPESPNRARVRRQPAHTPGDASPSAQVSAAVPVVAEATQPADPGASAAERPPSLLDTDATRRAIRASARAPALVEQLAAARSEPRRIGVQERLGADVKAAGRGDCAKGEYLGAGMGLLSVPFLALAAARGHCGQ